jgi:cyanophycinase
MAGWLAMIGGGEWKPGCVGFDTDLLALSGGTEVVVLPTAAAMEGPNNALANAEKHFTALGATVIPCRVLSRAEADDPENVAIVAKAKFIYLSSGSAMHLRSTMKGTAVWEALVASWRNGAVLAASAAGAMALGDPMVDPRGGAFTLGLGLFPGLAVVPQAEEWSNERKARTIKMAGKTTTLALVDQQTALLRSPEGRWSMNGAGDVYIVAAGAYLKIDNLHLRIP